MRRHAYGDIPITIALTDPFKGDLLHGDDRADDPLRDGRKNKGPDRTGKPEKKASLVRRLFASLVRLGAPKNRARSMMQAYFSDKLPPDQRELMDKGIALLASDPRFKFITAETPRFALSIMLAGLTLGRPYEEVSDTFFGDNEPITPDEASKYGFTDVAGYMMGSATEAPAPTQNQQEAELDGLLRELMVARKRVAELSPAYKEATKLESKLTADAIAVWRQIEDLTTEAFRDLDGVRHRALLWQQSASPALPKVIAELRVLMPSISDVLDELIAKHTAPPGERSKLEYKALESPPEQGPGVSRTPRKVQSRLKRAFASGLRSIGEMSDMEVASVSRLLRKLLAKMQSLVSGISQIGGEREFARAARRVRPPVEADWCDGIEHLAETQTQTGFKDGDTVTGKDGKQGTVTLRPDGGVDVEYDTGTVSYDQRSVSSGEVKRALRLAGTKAALRKRAIEDDDSFDDDDDDEDEAPTGPLSIMVENSDDDSDGPMVIITTHDTKGAEWDQTIMGDTWEIDGVDEFAYAIVPDQPGLVEKLRADGYEVDDSNYYPFDPEEYEEDEMGIPRFKHSSAWRRNKVAAKKKLAARRKVAAKKPIVRGRKARS